MQIFGLSMCNILFVLPLLICILCGFHQVLSLVLGYYCVLTYELPLFTKIMSVNISYESFLRAVVVVNKDNK